MHMSRLYLSANFKNTLHTPSSPASRCFAFHSHSITMTSTNTNTQCGARPSQQNQNTAGKRGGSKPRLTHFLCLPLVNSTSIPQLVSSLSEFRDSIPLVPPPVSARVAASAQLPDTPLFPDGALRPLGTLHLTLGVMSLPTKERLEEALAFLQSLDLESMLREAEIQARAAATREDSISNNTPAVGSAPQPLFINLISLHALPKAKAATILHAKPVDSTSRLYPLCVSLRNKFIEAGFIQQETIKRSPRSKNKASELTGKDNAGGGSDSQGSTGDHGGNNDNSGNVGAASLPVQGEATAASSDGKRVKPRPLLLHATIANTVYLPRRKQRGAKRKETLKFDARPLLVKFGDYVPPTVDVDVSDHEPAESQSWNLSLEVEEVEEKEKKEEGEREVEVKEKDVQVQKERKAPFVWAKDIPIDRVCICEMGAKPVPDDGANGGPLLGEAYVSVGERSLVFAPQMRGDGDGDGDGDNGDACRSEDGGVSLA
ncbi:uncharacterized protein BDCG_03242 [Blastomyces dermatitidis ER-3]|uniref:A-kinase anchor protein 7-like phosphoesterase domain-containing protein n=2 Tax=Ajellomyces dermatitidis TaxID=5039 RepID=F2T8B7_AJEDA|nr:uncharacterized protein BDCG_03242 [Blastomyces dermatitidis ER-3]EEQ88122.2 hypothetical protein BDCG_03242 [Blastomyces dermatitidis ER-3]EGE79480.2 hypothetical protein BDDG_02420 [Blastomyces dermatitidis ATCC 18188]